MLLFHKKLKTDRLILRKWLYSDLNNFYNYAKDEEIGELSGWRPHPSIYYSELVLKNTYLTPYHFAVALKENNKLIGNISLIPGANISFQLPRNEAELGYWIGRPYWNKGYITEAALKLIEYGFNSKNYNRIWAGAFDYNLKSQHVLEKCGFEFKYSILKNYEPDLTVAKRVNIYTLDIKNWSEINKKPIL